MCQTDASAVSGKPPKLFLLFNIISYYHFLVTNQTCTHTNSICGGSGIISSLLTNKSGTTMTNKFRFLASKKPSAALQCWMLRMLKILIKLSGICHIKLNRSHDNHYTQACKKSLGVPSMAEMLCTCHIEIFSPAIKCVLVGMIRPLRRQNAPKKLDKFNQVF